jgi:heavy metal sensor kinase
MIDSVRARLTAWYVGVLAVTLVLFELAVYAALSRTLLENVDAALSASIRTVATSLSNDIGEGQSRVEAARATVDELSSRQVAVAVFDTSGELIASRLDDDMEPRLPQEGVPDGEPLLFDISEEPGDDDFIRAAVLRVRVHPATAPFIVHVSTRLDPLEDDLEDIRTVLLSAIPAVLFVAGAAGWFMARKSLRPVLVMAERARAIGATNLDERLPVSNPRDELGRLAATFNELLTRLSAAFTQQRQFMADASHELKTPLATIRAAASVTLQQAQRTESEYRDALGMIDDQSARLTRIVEDMFTLARADAGHLPLRPGSFYLDELLNDIAAAARIRAADAGIPVVVSGATEVPCTADEELIRRLVTNLVDNGLKYSPPGQPVQIALEQTAGCARISVTNQGPPISPDAQAHLFERFFRGDTARVHGETMSGSGAGLGLAIARWIAHAHGGTLVLVRSDELGTTFAAEVPCHRGSSNV